MYHVVVSVDDNVKQGDIATLDVNPIYVAKEIRREYR